MKGLEPSTFCMASRRSSQLSYIRPVPRGWWIIDQAPQRCKLRRHGRRKKIRERTMPPTQAPGGVTTDTIGAIGPKPD